MNKKWYLSILLISLTSCSSTLEDKPDLKAFEVKNEGFLNPELGLVVLESEKEDNVPTSISLIDNEADCLDKMSEVKLSTSTSSESYYFDHDSKKCVKSKVLFDGAQDVFARSADPFISITFNDEFGKVSYNNNLEKTANFATVFNVAENDFSINKDLATKPYDELGRLDVDYRPTETEEKKYTDKLKLYKDESLRQARELAREYSEIQTSELRSENTELGYKNIQYKNQIENTLINLNSQTEKNIQLLNELRNTKVNKDIEINDYKQKVEMLEKRVEDYAQLALLLKQENQRLALTTEDERRLLTKDLTEAEEDLDELRYSKMMRLASDIEVNEKLAQALHDAQRTTLQRKAQRLQTQADTLAYHARADKVYSKEVQDVYKTLRKEKEEAFKGKLARVVGVEINKEPTLYNVELLIDEKNRSLRDILDEILLDIQPMVGTWKIDEKLATHNQVIMEEKWNVAAESTLFEFFDYIKARAKEIHGVDLQIDPFAENRRIVITDNF